MQNYIDAVRRVCEQAKSMSWSFDLLTTSPGEMVDDRLSVTYGVGGLVKLDVEVDLYDKLVPEMAPLVRKVLRDYTEKGRRKVEFYPE